MEGWKVEVRALGFKMSHLDARQLISSIKQEVKTIPNKRSRRKKVKKFYCPSCQQQLWRLGGPKYYLFYMGKAEIKEGFQLSSKKASFLANQQSTWLDTNVWIEEFFCETDGTIWMHLSQNEEKTIVARLATSEDWQRTTKTIDPEKPHSSVSEFTLRMSRDPSKVSKNSKFYST